MIFFYKSVWGDYSKGKGILLMIFGFWYVLIFGIWFCWIKFLVDI